MKYNDVSENIKSEIVKLTWDFKEEEETFHLAINDKFIVFNKCESEFDVKPNEWLRNKHKNGKVHEPGMIATLSFLSTIIEGKVIFYDVGALFGYFSIIAKTLFDDCDCILVEGNPFSSNSIPRIFGDLGGYKIKNVVLGSDVSSKNYLINGFRFIDASKVSFSFKLRVQAKNFIKSILNIFGANYQKTALHFFEIKEETLPNLFEKKDSLTTEIFKLDTEGYQSVFLPPFIDEFCAREPIVLLEFDHPHLMSVFGKTNDELLQLFLDRDYRAYWLNHRNPKEVKQIDEVGVGEDLNSLCVLLPNSMFNTV